MAEIIISTSELNSYGFRVLTSGLDYTNYLKNPILLWQHSRPSGYRTNEPLPIGRIENLRVDGDRLIGTPVFDSKDAFAAEIERKFNNGTLSAASAGIEIVETSMEDLAPGQVRPTVTKSKLIEVSIVDIPANPSALKLAAPYFPTVNEINPNFIALMNSNAKTTLPDYESQIAALKKEVEDLKKENIAFRKEASLILLEYAIECHYLDEEKKTHFIGLAEKLTFNELHQTLKSLKRAPAPAPSLSEKIKPEASPATPVQSLSELSLKELAALKRDNPEEYNRLYKAHYGFLPE